MTNRLLHRLHFKIFRFSQILVIFAYFFNKFPKINWNRNFSVKFSRNFAGISGNCRQLLQFTIFCTIFSKFARIFAVFCIIFRKKKAGWLAVRKMTPPPRRVINSHLKQPRSDREPSLRFADEGHADLEAVELRLQVRSHGGDDQQGQRRSSRWKLNGKLNVFTNEN